MKDLPTAGKFHVVQGVYSICKKCPCRAWTSASPSYWGGLLHGTLIVTVLESHPIDIQLRIAKSTDLDNSIAALDISSSHNIARLHSKEQLTAFCKR